ncbi:MAG: hypothetical protein XD76_1311 [candidate division TA06 bacterium 32_111]|uniref:Uncharacterized protein n=2 Tax=Bacteria candidate phyla TaxID=1783234 RepID=A0A117M6D8_UNCT6|nr:MAG: hypothetical protein XD76_1311 [candidate division TA06 bacterium 32_111]KUK86935.1 MAG: hypothetical protein XE03_1153 [candidate division TA06 bacterium 34_109]HAF07257.1 hypothetical protein [candidate division WOR-3 bacterium]HCP16630.1 hypothetical protein [candidate division WOR-3 bacterium]
MKKLLTIFTVILLSLVVLPVFGATASDNVDVQILIPARVGINITNAGALLFDLTSVAIPATFPAYYFPNGGETEILMDIFCNATAGYTLDVIASGDFSADVPVSQLFFAPSGTPITTDGTPTPLAPWTPFSTASVNVETGPRLTGWTAKNQAIEFKWEPDDPEIDPSSTVTLTYTITSL